jgi:small subunit ribosomal protein S6
MCTTMRCCDNSALIRTHRSAQAKTSTRSKSQSNHTSEPPIKHQPSNTPSRIAKTTGSLILNSGGVVRGITNWGTFLLPKPIRKQGGALYHQGHYFIVRFDSSSRTQHSVRKTLRLDPRMLRFSVVKMGSKLEEIAHVGGKAEWEGREEQA